MQVAIRVDASPIIGTGHLQRCLSLALALRGAGAAVTFVMRDLGIDVCGPVEGSGLRALRLPAPDGSSIAGDDVAHAHWAGVDALLDARQTAEALGGAAFAPDCVVVDHYAFDARWHRTLREALGSDIAVVDDLADRPLDGRWLIDHNLHPDHRRKYTGRWPEGACLLGGPSFALLGPAYADAPGHEPAEAVRSIGIFMGGSDVSQASVLALRACREVAGFDGPIEVVTTRANPARDVLAAAVAASPRTALLEDLPDLAAFFARHDLQIGAGGGAAWERCCIGAPSLLLTVAANQAAVVPQLERLGVVAAVQPGVGVEDIGRAVKRLLEAPALRREMSQRARALVDGLGARRVALRFAGDLGQLRLRPMSMVDAALTHGWRNHSATRAASRDPRPIARRDHEAWLASALADPRRRLSVAHVGRIDVGVIRFDDVADGGDCEVSLYLDPALHGLGLGAAMLRAGEAERRSHGAAARRFVATVLPHNAASRLLFERAGYLFRGDAGTKPFDADPDSLRRAAA